MRVKGEGKRSIPVVKPPFSDVASKLSFELLWKMFGPIFASVTYAFPKILRTSKSEVKLH
jgi:hypothetical protein